MSGRIYRRRAGDILQPERFTSGVVRGLRAKPSIWSGQYMQEPSPESGVIFNPNWWQYFKLRDPLPEFDIVAISVDCAFKSAAENDLVSIQKWGASGPRCYFLECETRHLGFAATKAAIKAMRNDGRHASVILIEDRANGSAIIEELRADPDFGADVIAIEPQGGKEARAHAASATVEAGNVYLPEDAPWLGVFLRTAAAFPAVRHDDDVDAATQFINWRRSRGQGVLGVLEYGKRILQDVAQGIRNTFGELVHPKPKPAASTAQAPAPPQPVIASSRPKPEEKFTCPIRTCRSTATIRLGAPNTVHCNSCSCDFTPWGDILRMPPQEDTSGHVCRWRAIPGGYERCDDDPSHIRYVGDGQPQARNGMSRAQYAQHEKRRRGFGRFSN